MQDKEMIYNLKSFFNEENRFFMTIRNVILFEFIKEIPDFKIEDLSIQKINNIFNSMSDIDELLSKLDVFIGNIELAIKIKKEMCKKTATLAELKKSDKKINEIIKEINNLINELKEANLIHSKILELIAIGDNWIKAHTAYEKLLKNH